MESAANSYIDDSAARFSSKETLDSTFNRSEKDVEVIDPSLPSPDSKSEVEVAANPKGGVMIYVRSQANSPRESISESQQDRMSDKSEGSRRSSGTTKAVSSETSGSRRSLHSIKSSKSNRSRKTSTPNLERKVTPAISEENLRSSSPPPPLNHNNRVLTNSELQLHDALSGDEVTPSAPPSTHDDQVLDESGTCHEEIILELTKAPLATMEDDTDGCRSLTTSCSSLNSSRHDTNRSLRHHSDDVIDDVNNESINSSSKAKSVSSLSSADKGSSHSEDGRTTTEELPPPPAHLTNDNDSSDDEGNQPPSYKDVIAADQPAQDEAPHTTTNNGTLPSSENTLEIYDFDPEKLVEIYDFNPSLEDFEIAKDLVKYSGISLSKVDEHHYLCILPTSDVTTDLLQEHFPNFSVRSIDQASRKTKQVAQNKSEESSSC